MTPELSAYDIGFRARLAGERQSANPYEKEPERGLWDSGWEDQNEHLNDRDEALASIGWFGRSR